MRWYMNDASLQNQFPDGATFEAVVRGLLAARGRVDFLRQNLRTARTIGERIVHAGYSVRRLVQQSPDRDFRSAVLLWLDRYGPFLEDDRQVEDDDYFEFAGADVTDSGLGEAARRGRLDQPVATFSFAGGATKFDVNPLTVDHGLPEDRLGQYAIENFWEVNQLEKSAIERGPQIESWRSLVEASRQRFPKLLIPDSVYLDKRIAREPFDVVIRDHALDLLGYLNTYMEGRDQDGAEGPRSRQIIDKYFTGDRAAFSGESANNQRDFKTELTFKDPEDAERTIFAHWHGKISRRFYRMHFEWPITKDMPRLKVLYLGPKITKG
jgi:hypothetical protein